MHPTNANTIQTVQQTHDQKETSPLVYVALVHRLRIHIVVEHFSVDMFTLAQAHTHLEGKHISCLLCEFQDVIQACGANKACNISEGANSQCQNSVCSGQFGRPNRDLFRVGVGPSARFTDVLRAHFSFQRLWISGFGCQHWGLPCRDSNSLSPVLQGQTAASDSWQPLWKLLKKQIAA